jgi:hypothetical protein
MIASVLPAERREEDDNHDRQPAWKATVRHDWRISLAKRPSRTG